MKEFVLIIFLLIFGITKGQSSSKLSRNFWLGHGVSFKVFKKTEMLFQAEQRFGVNNFEIDKNLIELGLKRNLSELSKLGLLYRTTWEDGADYRLRRYAGHHKFNILKGDFKFSNQLGFQFDVRDYTGETKSHIRDKIAMKYDYFKKVKPYFQCDFTFRFDNKNYIDNNRFSIGAKVRLKKNVKLKLFVRFDQQSNRQNPEQELIFGTRLALKI